MAQVSAVPGLEVKGPYSSVKKNKDGTEEKFTKTPDEKVITKETIGPDGVLRMTTVYNMEDGHPKTCDIFDGRGQKLYKSRYGYSRKAGSPSFGKLVEEQMLDARIKHIDPDTGAEMPVRRFIYSYNPDGSANPPVSISLVPGKTFEDAFASGLTFDPFKDGATKDTKPTKPPAKKK